MQQEETKSKTSDFIQRIYAGFFSRKALWFALAIFIPVFMVSLWHRYIQIDEDWFAEQAYWFIKEGIIRVKTAEQILNYDKQMFVFHRLFVYAAVVIIKFFGLSVYYLKAFTLFMYSVFLFVFYKHYTTNKQKFSFQLYLLATVLIVTVPLMVLHGFKFRPEITVMAFGFTSYFFIDKYLLGSKPSMLIFAGLFAGLAYATHMNGLIFSVAGFLILLFNKKYIGLLYFSAFASFGLLIYLDLLVPQNLKTFLWEMQNYPSKEISSTVGTMAIILRKLLNLFNEHQRFFWSDRVMGFSLLFFVSLISCFKYILKNHRTLLVYLTLLILSLNILGSHVAERYLISYIPFMALIIAIAILKIMNEKKYVLKSVLVSLVVFHLILCVGRFKFVFEQNGDTSEIHKEILSKIPDKKAKIFVNPDFVFNEIGKYNLVSYKAMEYYQFRLNRVILPAEFYQTVIDRLNIKYLVLDVKRIKDSEFDWYASNKIEKTDLFKPIFECKDYLILERNK